MHDDKNVWLEFSDVTLVHDDNNVWLDFSDVTLVHDDNKIWLYFCDVTLVPGDNNIWLDICDVTLVLILENHATSPENERKSRNLSLKFTISLFRYPSLPKF